MDWSVLECSDQRNITANHGTEGANKNYLFWTDFEFNNRFPHISLSFAHIILVGGGKINLAMYTLQLLDDMRLRGTYSSNKNNHDTKPSSSGQPKFSKFHHSIQ
jgi:hypothetical protein